MRLTMMSAGKEDGTGFVASVGAMEKGKTCSYDRDVVLLETKIGQKNPSPMLFEAPNFGGTGQYLPDHQCLFILKVPYGRKVRLEFLTPIDIKVIYINLNTVNIVSFCFAVYIERSRFSYNY